MMLSSKYLTHKHASFIGCTFFEAAVIFTSVLVTIVCIQSVLTLIFGHWYMWFFLNLMIFKIFKLTAGKVGKAKEYKPQGYISQGMRVRLAKFGLMKSPYFNYTGRLVARRRT